MSIDRRALYTYLPLTGSMTLIWDAAYTVLGYQCKVSQLPSHSALHLSQSIPGRGPFAYNSRFPRLLFLPQSTLLHRINSIVNVLFWAPYQSHSISNLADDFYVLGAQEWYTLILSSSLCCPFVLILVFGLRDWWFGREWWWSQPCFGVWSRPAELGGCWWRSDRLHVN